ncbi:hypothetical protein POM88_023006 [Heracleum sosnowskyi]|uniref:Uncharacterized protein n=1 Tax=Heracleum sosnowskyi TaxID=360622 RepID=A0AAD8IHX5_9APIA|nr:hypothetical protein POM88_023006 [Heracleum sosnowskyi]
MKLLPRGFIALRTIPRRPTILLPIDRNHHLRPLFSFKTVLFFAEMGDNFKVLRFVWRGEEVNIRVDVDKISLLDLIVTFEDEVKELGIKTKMNYHYPTFGYSYEMEHHKLVKDSDLMKMRRAEADKGGGENKGNGGDEITGKVDNVGDEVVENEGNGKERKKPAKKPNKKAVMKSTLPAPISPQTAFKSLTVRRSPRFIAATNPSQTESTITIPDQGLFSRKIPKTTAKRKGLLYSCSEKQGNSEVEEGNATQNAEIYELGEPSDRVKNVKRQESSRKDWTIISDRQKGIDLAIEKVWPTVKRRCRPVLTLLEGIRRVCMTMVNVPG